MAKIFLNITLLFLNPKTLLIILGIILPLFPGIRSIQLNNSNLITNKEYTVSNKTTENAESDGYSAVIEYKDGFLATGKGGKIDWISLSGKVTKSELFPEENFNCLLSDNNTLIAGGANGTVMISSDNETFRKINSGTDNDINTLALFNEIIIAGTNGGEIILGDFEDFFQIINLDIKGNVVSISARSTDCYGVTDEGEIIHSTDGINWVIFDFNNVYKGFYKSCSFTSVLVTSNRIAVAGIHDDGSPAILFSNKGGVWTERNLDYTDEQGMNGYLTDVPNDIFYDDYENQFYLACSNGKLMTLPSCSHCNILFTITEENLQGISCNGNTLMIVGDNYFTKSINIR